MNYKDQVILNFTQQEYLPKIRKIIALKYNTQNTYIEMNNEQKKNYEKLLNKRKKYIKKTTSEDAKTLRYRYARLRLDDAIKQLEGTEDPTKAFEGWSEARIRAYKMIDTKPNTYYYRFNKPGEKQRHGQWSKQERESFFKRLKEVGADGQWGLFSMAITGRVGYQCSNFYRQLLKDNIVQDPNYIVTKDGKMHYLFGKKDGHAGVIKRHSHGITVNGKKLISGGTESDDVLTTVNSGNGSGASNSPSTTGTSITTTTHTTNTSTSRKRKHKSRKRSWDRDDSDNDYFDPDDEDDSGNYTMKWTTKRTRSRMNITSPVVDENPLPGFIDPITLEEVVKPAISPYGHVMGYDSWVRSLNNPTRRNICPITKKPLTKRELIILTMENIDQYRDKIINK